MAKLERGVNVIIVEVRRGVVVDVRDIPPGVEVEVRDYDNVVKDDNGEMFSKDRWVR